MSTAYQRGSAFERRVKAHLEKLGYVVCRSPKSRGPYDLIAVGKTVVMLIQCKIGGVLRPAEWNVLYAMAIGVNAVPMLVDRDKRKLRFWQMLERKNGQKRQPRSPFHVLPSSGMESAQAA